MADPAEQAASQAQPAAATAELNEFESLLNKEFKPKTAEAKSAVKLAVQTLVQRTVRRYENELRAESHGLNGRHRRSHPESTDLITCCGHNAAWRRPADGHRFPSQRWISENGSRGKHGVDVAEENLSGPSSGHRGPTRW